MLQEKQRKEANEVFLVYFLSTSNKNFTNSSINFTAHLNMFQLATQPALTCSMLTIETLGQGVKYAQS